MRNWKTDKYLCDKFNEFNRKYFGNKLIGTVRVGWRKPFVEGHAGETIPVKDEYILLLINPKLRRVGAQNYALSTLLHEMCHVKLWQQGKKVYTHGPLFQNEMKRLARIGAFNTIW
jgi:hypothetical protein